MYPCFMQNCYKKKNVEEKHHGSALHHFRGNAESTARNGLVTFLCSFSWCSFACCNCIANNCILSRRKLFPDGIPQLTEIALHHIFVKSWLCWWSIHQVDKLLSRRPVHAQCIMHRMFWVCMCTRITITTNKLKPIFTRFILIVAI